MHFQLFLPGPVDDVDAIAAAGVRDLVIGTGRSIDDGPNAPPGHGPDGNVRDVRFDAPGLLFSNGAEFARDAATWKPAAPTEDLAARRYWIGVNNASPPRPEELRRETVETSKAFIFGDGNTWQLPIVDQLTRDVKISPEGRWTYQPVGELRYFAEIAHGLRDRIRTAAYRPDRAEFEWSELARFLLTSLRVNYRVCAEVATALRLFNSTNIIPAAFWSIEGHYCEPAES